MRPSNRAKVFENIGSNESDEYFKDAFKSIADNNARRNPYDEIEEIFCSSLPSNLKLEKILHLIINDILDSGDFEIPEITQQIKYDEKELSKFDDGSLPSHYVDIISNPLILAFHIREDSKAVQHPENVDCVIKIRLLHAASQEYFDCNKFSNNSSARKLAEECKKIVRILTKYSYLINYREA